MPAKIVPATLEMDLACAIAGVPLDRGYEAANSGAWPLLPGGGRRRIVTANFETKVIFRRLTVEDIEAAEEKLAPVRARKAKAARECRARRLAREQGTAVA